MSKIQINLWKLVGIAIVITVGIVYVNYTELRINTIKQDISQVSNDTVGIVSALMQRILDQSNLVKELDKNINNKIDNRLEQERTEIIRDVENNTNESIENKLVQQKINKIKLEQTLKQINVMIVNKTLESLGSGVSIKYKGKFYILTAGHLATSDTDELYLYENKSKICKLEVVKHAYTEVDIDTNANDLLLLRPVNSNVQPKFYTELAENEPITGTQVYIVGNPMGIEDVLSDGRTIFYKDNFMYYIDHTYFGNSGGGVYDYNGKVIGIVSHMINLKPAEIQGVGDYVINGAVRLDTILEFLKNVG